MCHNPRERYRKTGTGMIIGKTDDSIQGSQLRRCLSSVGLADFLVQRGKGGD